MREVGRYLSVYNSHHMSIVYNQRAGMKVLVSVYFLFALFLVDSLNGSVPRWLGLDCEVCALALALTFHIHISLNQEGHEYLFSYVEHTWDMARAECELYGGWLVSIKTQSEYNCLLRYGHSQGMNSWFWTDGMMSYKNKTKYFIGSDCTTK